MKIDLPGGGREGDESPFDTFKREVMEEFGISIEENDIYFSRSYVSRKNPLGESYFIITKPLNLETSSIIFGNEGIEWFLMTLDEFINRSDGIKEQQEDVVKYLNRELLNKHGSGSK